MCSETSNRKKSPSYGGSHVEYRQGNGKKANQICVENERKFQLASELTHAIRTCLDENE